MKSERELTIEGQGVKYGGQHDELFDLAAEEDYEGGEGGVGLYQGGPAGLRVRWDGRGDLMVEYRVVRVDRR
jgi:hypothetical protein